MTQCFFLEQTDFSTRELRRYAASSVCKICPHGYHDATVPIGKFPALTNPEGYESSPDVDDYADDERWPKRAPCGYEFRSDDARHVKIDRIYRRTDTNQEMSLRTAPPGAMWDAWWFPRKGPDGLSLVVKCPDGRDWMIDSRCNNCALPEDNVHRCWCRHGAPPKITVDKDCNTCPAGGGSIDTGTWHGFLRNGVFTLA